MHKISLEENRGKERQAGKILQERTRKLAVRFLVYNLSCLLIFLQVFHFKGPAYSFYDYCKTTNRRQHQALEGKRFCSGDSQVSG